MMYSYAADQLCSSYRRKHDIHCIARPTSSMQLLKGTSARVLPPCGLGSYLTLPSPSELPYRWPVLPLSMLPACTRRKVSCAACLFRDQRCPPLKLSGAQGLMSLARGSGRLQEAAALLAQAKHIWPPQESQRGALEGVELGAGFNAQVRSAAPLEETRRAASRVF